MTMRRPKNSSRQWSRAGLTLIEVVAAVAILGTILVGVVLAKSRHTHQLALAERKMAAVRAADELIAGWWTGSGVPIGGSGMVEGYEALFWQTRVVPNEAVGKLGASVLRVELFESGASEAARGNADDTLVTVDLVLPAPSGKLNEAAAGMRPRIGSVRP